MCQSWDIVLSLILSGMQKFTEHMCEGAVLPWLHDLHDTCQKLGMLLWQFFPLLNTKLTKKPVHNQADSLMNLPAWRCWILFIVPLERKQQWFLLWPLKASCPSPPVFPRFLWFGSCWRQRFNWILCWRLLGFSLSLCSVLQFPAC